MNYNSIRCIELSRLEYAKIVSEINTNYNRCIGKDFCIHISIGEDNKYYSYIFKNEGFDNYIFLSKKEI